MTENLSSEEIYQRVISITSEVLALDGPLTLDMNLHQDLKADSLELLTLFMTLEDEFGGSIPHEDIEDFATLRDIVEYINGRIAAEQSEH